MKTRLLPVFITVVTFLITSCQKEADSYLKKEEIKMTIQNDKEYKNYLEVKTHLFNGLVYERWKIADADKAKIRTEASKAISRAEVKKIYQANGIDSSYIRSLEENWRSCTYIKSKYRKYFIKYPSLWNELEREAYKDIKLDIQKIKTQRTNSVISKKFPNLNKK